MSAMSTHSSFFVLWNSSQVALVAKFILLMPATSAVFEQCSLALPRIKIYLGLSEGTDPTDQRPDCMD